MKVSGNTRYLVLSFIFAFLALNAYGRSIHWNRGRGYSPFEYATKEGILFNNTSDTLEYDYFALPAPSRDLILNFRAKNINGHPSKKYNYYNNRGKSVGISNPHWGFFIYCLRDTFAVTVKTGEKFTALEPMPGMEISLHNLRRGSKESVTLTDKVNPYDGDNLWNIEVSDGILDISVGDHEMNSILNYPIRTEIFGFGFFAGWGDSLLISDINVTFDGGFESDRFELDDLDYYLSQSNDPMEGYWTVFDRELEESLLKLGGNYKLACVKDGDDYIFIYLEGASINQRNWKPGDIKAVLSPTPFPEIYDVEWFDAMKESFNNDLKAQFGSGNTLGIQFPYQSSKIRLRKLPDSTRQRL